MGTVNVFSFLLCALILVYASYSDLKRRTVSNVPWLVMAIAGLALLAYHAANGRASLLAWSLVSSISTFVIAYLFFRFGLFGAADAKCLISMAVLFPKYPSFVVFSFGFPILSTDVPEVVPLAFTTLTYASLLALVAPLLLVFRNLRDLGFRGLWQNVNVVFIGYRVRIDHITSSKHVRLAHSYQEQDGKLKMRLALRGVEIDAAVIEQLKSYQQQGQLGANVWVTPDLPFMVFITAGFLVAALVGNFISLVFA